MFYIDNRSLRKQEVLLLHILPTVIVLLAFLGATFLSWSTAQKNINDEQISILNQQNDSVAEQITQRMNVYENVLLGAAGLFKASDEVSRDEWHSYYESFLIADRYPGIQGLGYVKMLEPNELASYDGAKIYPPGKRAIYSSITYIEPMSDRNKRALGFDMYAEPTRRSAMDEAAEKDQPVITDIVRLIQESKTSDDQQPGFLMYLPINASQKYSDYIYAPFRTHDLMNSTITDLIPGYEYKISNIVSQDNEQPIFESKGYNDLLNSNSTKQQVQTMPMYGKQWQISGVASQQVVDEELNQRPASILFGGIVFSFLIAGFLYTLLGNRSRALAQKEEQSLQDAKDELLALASHQLRTPATGVKQYVGMLREGFAGEMTDTQQKLIEKAYESNERQLNTINEMLFVARADAGHLKMDSKPIVLNKLLSSIVDEQSSVINSREQTVKIVLPKKKITTLGDEQYLRMAIENILSNASKYTHSGGRINLTLKSKGDKAIVSIKDTGVGVAPEDQTLLFKKFSRIPNELTDQVVGSGIGLYLAKNIVEGHQGEIDFQSKVGKGSTVTITLNQQIAAKA